MAIIRELFAFGRFTFVLVIHITLFMVWMLWALIVGHVKDRFNLW